METEGTASLALSEDNNNNNKKTITNETLYYLLYITALAGRFCYFWAQLVAFSPAFAKLS